MLDPFALNMKHFNLIVIGKGLVGSAAAKYLSNDDSNVAVIGPDEPTDYDESIVFGSHYDQTRVQRIIGKDQVWTKLNLNSVKQYAYLQKQSGVYFHHPVGCLYVNPIGKDEYLQNAEVLGKSLGLTFQPYRNGREIARDFKEFKFPAEAEGLFEESPAGYINPRLLLKAQLQMLEQKKVVIFRETVLGIEFLGDRFNLKTHEGNSYAASKVLVATGSFVNFPDLIPQKLDMRTKSEVVLSVKLGDKEAERLSRLPSLLYEIDDGEKDGVYMVQPVKYPDGSYYLKLGCNTPEDIAFQNLEQVQEWFRKGESDRFAPKMLEALQMILPNLSFSEYATKRCITSYTAHGRPFIGETARPGLYVAGGCNGYSAMCSDAIGNVAANLMINRQIPDGYDQNAFELCYKK